ncbi:MAG: Npt1/Npt2 family nucleotide transporter [Proteobacteria bacterium]|nr:Npt1/Npt2 family nucleotide transporter [Pseudomonadota bacterium]
MTTTRQSRLVKRSLALFSNFFLIILAYYQVKSASRSLLIEFGGSQWFPYAWVYSAVVLTLLIGVYHAIVERFSRVRVVLGSLLLVAALLVLFRTILEHNNTLVAVAFYIFVDIFSVVLVEQFWSLTVSITDPADGKRSFWFVGTGGLVGGVAGGYLASVLVESTALQTADLLHVCAAILISTFVLNLFMWRAGMYEEIPAQSGSQQIKADWRALLKNNYLLLIAAVVCLSQLAQPVVEYQFISAVEQAYSDLDQRTAFIGKFFSVMGLVSIAINLIATPLIHRYLGFFAGLVVQPLVLSVCSFGFYFSSSLTTAAIMKIGDRGLSYSINRASKEQLYIPVDPIQTYQAKAWIDMLGYRLFKVIGSGLILLTTQWTPLRLDMSELSFLTIAICAFWIITTGILAKSYRQLVRTA